MRWISKAIAVVSALLLFAAADAKLHERQRALHVLNRLAFGPRAGEVERVAQIGVDRWIDQQLHPERIADTATDTRLAAFRTLKLSNADIVRTYYVPLVMARQKANAAAKEGAGEKQDLLREMRRDMPPDARPQLVTTDLVSQRIIRAAESDRQLNEVLVDFWMNHFNVFAGKGVDRFLLTSYERDAIRPHVWGRFEDLLMATAKSPAMLFYLDNARSANGKLNENYAREIMELHTLGVDAGYTQKDVTELARVFTGWTIVPPNGARLVAQEPGSFIFRPRLHDSSAKTVLGVHIAAGGGMDEGERMIHLLAHHPATAHHIAFKLCQRLVADDPPRALVDRVAKRFS
jgi:uncharacterized protein (DUF1800 family)